MWSKFKLFDSSESKNCILLRTKEVLVSLYLILKSEIFSIVSQYHNPPPSVSHFSSRLELVLETCIWEQIMAWLFVFLAWPKAWQGTNMRVMLCLGSHHIGWHKHGSYFEPCLKHDIEQKWQVSMSTMLQCNFLVIIILPFISFLNGLCKSLKLFIEMIHATIFFYITRGWRKQVKIFRGLCLG